ncbi:ABC transporter permease [Fuscibacter oryzae]|uniref:ABC transporter permease n=1 Tax=Fuscibacter oryzae TaxID=2803939 RepID=A0A8J7MSB9_9RHOB|nr:ABC transporter permease [Fuscibacter oryzae]MBL4929433.1 ABC transporter permease [Fuscibacter oryzae]
MVLRTYVWLYLLFLFGPLAVITLFAFHSSPALSFPFEGFSLKWFRAILDDPQFLAALKNSTIVAVAASVLTGILGTLAALALPRLPKRSLATFNMLTFAPIALPGLFLGIALLALFERLGIYRSLWTVTIAHTLFTLPFFIETVRSRVAYFDASLEEAARDLGATPVQTFRLVTLPILFPTLMGGMLLSFALSFDEVVITVFVVGEKNTLPFYILSMMRRTVNPTINAASVLAMGLSLASLLLGGLFFLMQRRRAQARRAENE